MFLGGSVCGREGGGERNGKGEGVSCSKADSYVVNNCGVSTYAVRRSDF